MYNSKTLGDTSEETFSQRDHLPLSTPLSAMHNPIPHPQKRQRIFRIVGPNSKSSTRRQHSSNEFYLGTTTGQQETDQFPADLLSRCPSPERAERRTQLELTTSRTTILDAPDLMGRMHRVDRVIVRKKIIRTSRATERGDTAS